jgi:hypothetical protein
MLFHVVRYTLLHLYPLLVHHEAFEEGKLAVDVETIAGFLALELNLPSNYIWEEFCK